MSCRSARRIGARVVAVCLLAATVHAAPIYVSTTGNDTTGDGAAWGTAYASLTKAISVATAGAEIWVAKGQYNEAATLTVTVDGLSFYGSLNGDEAFPYDMSGRNLDANATTLTVTAANSRVININPSAATGQHRWDGFAIRDANVTNLSGAGMQINNGNVIVANCLFFNNRISVVPPNSYQSGAGLDLYNNADAVTVSDCRFCSNTITNYLAANHDSTGAGIRVRNGAAAVPAVIQRCRFERNYCDARDRTTDLARVLGSALSIGAPDVRVLDCDFVANEARSPKAGLIGGAVYCSRYSTGFTNFYIDRCRFLGNVVAGNGGVGAAIHLNQPRSTIYLNNCYFYGNKSVSSDGVTPRGGHVLGIPVGWNTTSGFIAKHCTFDRNTAGAGGTKYIAWLGGPNSPDTYDNKFYNCIFSGFTNESAAFRIENNGSATVDYALWDESNSARYFSFNNTASAVNTNPVVDTGFALTPGSPDVARGAASQPAIDKAPSAGLSPDVDLYGASRPVDNVLITNGGGAYDIGCHESQEVPVSLSRFAIE